MAALEGSIQILYKTAAQFTASNYTLLAGQEGHESNTGKRKIGDGVTAWISLPYIFDFSSDVDGSGTIGTIPLWTATSTLGDSYLTQSGNNVRLASGKILSSVSGQSTLDFGTTGGEYFEAVTPAHANSFFGMSLIYNESNNVGQMLISKNRIHLYRLVNGSAAYGLFINNENIGVSNIGNGGIVITPNVTTAITHAGGNQQAAVFVNSNGVVNAGIKGSAVFGEGRTASVDYTAYFTNADIAGSLKYVDGNQAAGRVLTSDLNGVATWQAVAAGGVTSVNGYTGIVTLAKSDVGLGNVENTALSTWAGSTNITTLGTIGTGTWSATTIGISNGGTNNTTATSGGVAYYDGTKYTTDSALQFNGTSFGIGMTPVNILDITKSQNATSIISLLNPGVGTLAASSLLLGMSSIRKVSLQYINQGYTLVAGSESISTADTGVLLSGTTTTALHYVAANASGNHKFYTAGIASSNERMRIAANGNTTLTPSSASLGNLIVATSTGGSSGVSVGIGTITAPTYGIDIVSQDAFVTGVRSTLYVAGNAPAWISRNSRGTIASPTTLLDNDVMGAFAFLGNKNTSPTFAYGGYFSCEVDGVPSTNIPSRFVFKTSTAAGAALVEAMRINAAQNVGIQTGATITAKLHLGAGTATASTSPQKYTAGALLTVIEAFAKEANGQGTYQTSNALNRCAEGGAIVDYFTDANNTGTGETDLYTYTTKANTFAANGEKLEAWYSGTFNDLTATSQLKVYFAGTAIADTGALTVSAIGGWKIDVALIRVSSTVVRYVVNISTPGASTAIYTSSGELTGLTLSNTNIIKITGTAGGGTGGNSDITAKSGSIYWYGSAAN